MGGGLGHVPTVAGRTHTPSLAGEGHDKTLAAARAESACESKAEDAALEIAAEFLLDVARHGPLGAVAPLEPALEVLGDDPVERCLLGAATLVAACRRGAGMRPEAEPQGKRGGGSDHGQTGAGAVYVIARTLFCRRSDTSMIVTDMLADVFGYDKYSEITREYAIRGTYCDLATKIDGKLQTLIEVKAIGVGLRDNHMKQVVDYAANQGIEWVVLTNGQIWKVFSVSFSKPISADLVLELDILSLDHNDEDSVEDLFLLSKEGVQRSGLDTYNDQLRVRSRFNLAALIMSDTVLHTIRRELKRLSPDVRISVDEIRDALFHEVLKREVLEGEKADEAKKLVNRAANKVLRQKKAKGEDADTGVVAADESPAAGGEV